MFIYKITCILNQKIYIGCTSQSPDRRFQYHVREARRESKGRRRLTRFHEAIIKYGAANFTIETLEIVDTIDEMYQRESYWINQLHSTNPNIGYNMACGGKSGKKSDATKRLISEQSRKNWENENCASRMKDGLNKGIITWKNICADNRVTIVCAACGKSFCVPPYMSKTRKFCSQKCSSSCSFEKGLERANELNLIANTTRRNHFRDSIMKWANENRDIVIDCPYNKISTQLHEIQIIASNTLGATDWRSICLAICGCTSKKKLLQFMKETMCEKIC